MLMRLVLPAVALACAVPAAAEPVSVAVSWGDLDLTRAAGRATLEERIERAVRRVCGPAVTRDLTRMAQRRACLVEARASATPQVELAYEAANARRVAALATKLVVFAGF
ncbi:UrcA family protein [Erythrobacter sp. NE805]|uniref:UrcA family protein n=1 Tax=Erythrobacter sp. NE805 TaxID=3389875 RepID=UPI00396B0DDF